ncbi:MAG: DUF58 domain-containing protein, partial [Gammaproteobacteria bacterium]|nr:DUF58 domain-containing protein [Gammaproteobacteria bacterium]
HIDWKGWARLGIPIVKEFFDSSLARQAVVLDTGLPAGASRACFEVAVSAAASFVAPIPGGTGGAGGAPELVFIGAEPHAIAATGGLGAADGVLECLACVEPDAAFAPRALGDALAVRANELSTCVCVLLAWDAPRRELVEMLCRAGVQVLVLVAQDDPAAVRLHPGPLAHHPERLRVLPAADPGPALATLGAVRGAAA